MTNVTNENQSSEKEVVVKIEFPKIKKIYVLIALIMIAMFITNPTKAEFNNYIDDEYEMNFQHTTSSGYLKTLDELNRSLAKYEIYSKYERSNYYLFSIYSSSESSTNFKKNYIAVFKIFL